MKQESIDSAFDPTNIAKKKEKHEAAQKLPPEVQARINLRVFNYVVADALPLSTVESEHFRDLIREIDPRVQVICVKTLKANIAAEFLKYKDDLRGKFQSAIAICLTADAWGSKHRSFLGVTAHWFLAEKNKAIIRKSAGIACKRFVGKYFGLRTTKILIYTYFLILFRISHPRQHSENASFHPLVHIHGDHSVSVISTVLKLLPFRLKKVFSPVENIGKCKFYSRFLTPFITGFFHLHF